jgi:hypothetical protein
MMNQTNIKYTYIETIELLFLSTSYYYPMNPSATNDKSIVDHATLQTESNTHISLHSFYWC